MSKRKWHIGTVTVGRNKALYDSVYIETRREGISVQIFHRGRVAHCHGVGYCRPDLTCSQTVYLWVSGDIRDLHFEPFHQSFNDRLGPRCSPVSFLINAQDCDAGGQASVHVISRASFRSDAYEYRRANICGIGDQI